MRCVMAASQGRGLPCPAGLAWPGHVASLRLCSAHRGARGQRGPSTGPPLHFAKMPALHAAPASCTRRALRAAPPSPPSHQMHNARRRRKHAEKSGDGDGSGSGAAEPPLQRKLSSRLAQKRQAAVAAGDGSSDWTGGADGWFWSEVRRRRSTRGRRAQRRRAALARGEQAVGMGTRARMATLACVAAYCRGMSHQRTRRRSRSGGGERPAPAAAAASCGPGPRGAWRLARGRLLACPACQGGQWAAGVRAAAAPAPPSSPPLRCWRQRRCRRGSRRRRRSSSRRCCRLSKRSSQKCSSSTRCGGFEERTGPASRRQHQRPQQQWPLQP